MTIIERWVMAIIIVLFFNLIILLPLAHFFSCGVESEIINERYGTNYSALDMFLCGDTIRNIVIGEKKNISVSVVEVENAKDGRSR